MRDARLPYDDIAEPGVRVPADFAALCAEADCPALPTRGRYCPVHGDDMTESQRTRKALAEVRDVWPTALIYKINDRLTKGIPDAYIAHLGRSLWVEFKDADTETVQQLMATPRGKLQHRELRRLYIAGVWVFVVVFRGTATEIYHGDSLDVLDTTRTFAEFLTYP